MKIVTFTLNPAIDLTIKLEKLIPGEVHRAETSSVRAGGKGVNVSTNIAGYGIDNAAGGFLGSDNAEIFERHLLNMNIRNGFVRVGGVNRTNIKIVDAAGTTDVNLNGLSVSEHDVKKLLSMADDFFSNEKRPVRRCVTRLYQAEHQGNFTVGRTAARKKRRHYKRRAEAA
jgi:1-phosphofructokinase